jgi:hypothetical protein
MLSHCSVALPLSHTQAKHSAGAHNVKVGAQRQGARVITYSTKRRRSTCIREPEEHCKLCNAMAPSPDVRVKEISMT